MKNVVSKIIVAAGLLAIVGAMPAANAQFGNPFKRIVKSNPVKDLRNVGGKISKYGKDRYISLPREATSDFGTQDSVRRELWSGQGHGGRKVLRRTGQKSWVEHKSEGSGYYYFKEVRKTDDAIFLLDRSRGIELALTKKRTYFRSTGQSKWNLLANGRWIR